MISTLMIGATDFQGANLDSLLADQQIRGENLKTDIFDPLDNPEICGLSEIELEDYRFLLAYMPLADLAIMSSADVIDNIRLARHARQTFGWADQVDESLFRHFILPHRVSQEPFVRGWRSQFLDEITPRIKGMSMTNAALEVNHWCHELATFEQSSGRDQDPLTTVRAGLGRCEEEMILTIAALRAVGLPARQCYTPYWAHCDNNHAWTEVWADGEWHYTGGCEPKPRLGDAWFGSSAGRAMLVVSTAYGDYYGDEPVLRRYGRSTLINSTPAYGHTRNLTVTLQDADGKPVPDESVIFNLWNYGTFMPALGMRTDEDGKCTIDCGNGAWFITAGKDDLAAAVFNTPDRGEEVLTLQPKENLNAIREIDYMPPPPVPALERPAATHADTLFRQRLSAENVRRVKYFWSVWAKDAGITVDTLTAHKPTGELFAGLIRLLEERELADSAEVMEKFTVAHGNWGVLYRFVVGTYPVVSAMQAHPSGKMNDDDEQTARWMFLSTLTKKDLRDFSLGVLSGQYLSSALGNPDGREDLMDYLNAINEKDKARYFDYVVTPRLGWEPSVDWRTDLKQFINIHPELVLSIGDKLLIEWIEANIQEIEKPDRLAPRLSPDLTLKLGKGTRGDIQTLVVGLCRVRGIPARFNEVTGVRERWENSCWNPIDLFSDDEEGEDNEGTGGTGNLFVEISQLEIQQAPDQFNQMPESPETYYIVPSDSSLQKVLYLQDWAVSSWNDLYISPLDFGYKEPFESIAFPQEIPVGMYVLTTGYRDKTGGANVHLEWFNIEDGQDTHINLQFRQSNNSEKP